MRGELSRRAAGGAGAVLGADRHLRAEDQQEAELARPHMRAHRAMDAITVGQGERRQPEGVCLLDQLVGAARPLEKREVALAPQRDVGHRALFPLSATAPPPAMRGAAAPDASAGRHPPPVRVVHAQPLSHHLEGHAARRARGGVHSDACSRLRHREGSGLCRTIVCNQVRPRERELTAPEGRRGPPLPVMALLGGGTRRARA